MRATEFIIVAEAKQRLDPSCWKGYRKAGTKVKGGVRVNNCVPVKKKANESVEYTLQVKGQAVMKYQRQSDAEQALLDLKSKFPKQDIRVVQTVCKDLPVSEAHINQQVSRYHPDTKTFRSDGVSHPLPGFDPDDIMNKGEKVDRFDNRAAAVFDPTEPTMLDRLEQRIDRERLQLLVKSFLNTLPGPHRELLIYRLWDGLDQNKTAKKMGITVDRERGMESTAIRTLRKNKEFLDKLRPFVVNKPDREIDESAPGTKKPQFSGWLAISYGREGAASKFPSNVRAGAGVDLNNPVSANDLGSVELDDDEISVKIGQYLKNNFGLTSEGGGAGLGYNEHFYHLPTARGFDWAIEFGGRLLAGKRAVERWFNEYNQTLRKVGLPEYTVDVWGGITSPIWHNDTTGDVIANLDQILDITKGSAKLGDFWNQGQIRK